MSDKKRKSSEKEKPKHPSANSLDGGRQVEINPRRYDTKYREYISTNPLMSKDFIGMPPKIPGKKRKSKKR